MYKSDNKVIVKNTIILYMRMLITMGISLYVSRSILNTLGETNFGIYNAVGGFVALFTMISGSMSGATQRYISYEIANVKGGDVKKVFSTALNIHFILAIVIVVIGELIGIWFINSKMNFPADRYFAATMVYHISLFTFAMNIISIPYLSAIIAYEKFTAYAYFNILEVLLNLVVSFLIIKSPIDNLIYYALLLATIAIIIRVLYVTYVKYNFKHCRHSFKIDKTMLREMTSYVGWNTIGEISGSVKEQGLNILSNIFFGAGVNAARGLAEQVSSAVSKFSGGFQMAMNPQIVKLYAAGQKENMFTLVFRGSKLSYLLLSLFAIPIIIEAPFILGLWLIDVPNYTVEFVRIILLTAMIDSVSKPLITAMQASGKIRNYQIVVGGTMLLTLPVAYGFLKLGFDPKSVLWISLCFSIICLSLRIIMLNRTIEFPIFSFVKKVICPLCVVTIVSYLPAKWISIYLEDSFFSLICTLMLTTLFAVSSSYFIALNAEERTMIMSFIKKKLKK